MNKFIGFIRKIAGGVLSTGLFVGLLMLATRSLAADHEERLLSYSPALQTRLDDIISHFKGCHIGVSIQSLSTGRVLYQHHANRGFVPASTLKLFTGIAALDYLGPHY